MNAPENDNPKNEVNDYLWDRSGAPDPEIERLESLLAEFRLPERALVLSAEMSAGNSTKVTALLNPFPWIPRLAAAAVIVLAFTAGILFALRPASTPPPDSGIAWNVSNLQGAPQIGMQVLSTGRDSAKLRVGQTLTTNSSSRASLSDNDFGRIQVDPDSRLRLLQSSPDRNRLQLELGTIHAYIWAPPTQFVVDTPSAIAVDLGCAYTLHVASDGSGSIRTTLGWVGFHLNGRDAFIPAGAMCSMRPHVGPGTPYFEDAAEKFRDSVARFDSATENTAEQQSALAALLPEARVKDALTLWHLLSRTTGQQRSQVYDCLAALVAPPKDVSRGGILQLNPRMLDLYWNALNLGDISLWRYWEQSAVSTNTPPSL
jgi:FecR protein